MSIEFYGAFILACFVLAIAAVDCAPVSPRASAVFSSFAAGFGLPPRAGRSISAGIA
jgi:hypothetical protein